MARDRATQTTDNNFEEIDKNISDDNKDNEDNTAMEAELLTAANGLEQDSK